VKDEDLGAGKLEVWNCQELRCEDYGLNKFQDRELRNSV
jgi:hypothetical protein